MREPRRAVTECEHTDEPHHCGGMCRDCYTKAYYARNKKKILARAAKKREEAVAWALEQQEWKRKQGIEVQVKGKQKVSRCEHTERMHFAKGLCADCYFKSRKEKQRIYAREYAQRKRDEESARKAIQAAEALTQNGPSRIVFDTLGAPVKNAMEMEELAKKLGVRASEEDEK